MVQYLYNIFLSRLSSIIFKMCMPCNRLAKIKFYCHVFLEFVLSFVCIRNYDCGIIVAWKLIQEMSSSLKSRQAH